MSSFFISKMMRCLAALLLFNLPFIMVTQQQTYDKPVDKVTLNFDSIFPNTPYKKALDASMSLAGDIHDLKVYTTNAHQMVSVDMTDLLVGKLFRLKQAIDSIKENKFVLLAHDLDYLNGIVDKIESVRKQLTFNTTDDSVELISDLMLDIQGTLAELDRI